MNTISNCPICNHDAFKLFLKGKDYSVSQEDFNIVSCNKCGFHFTNPIPSEAKIGAYYKSESYVSHSSSNKGLINKIYLQVRKYTLKKKVDLVKQFTKSDGLLDIGAGTGHFINACQSKGINALGLEPDEDARNYGVSNFNVNVKDINELHVLKDNSRDVITMWHVLEHVYHLNRDVEKITRILKDDGKLIVAVPNMNSYDAKIYGEFWAAFDLPIHLYHFTPSDIEALFDKYNLKIDEMLPMKFDSFYVSMLSEKYKGGNLMRAFWNGLLSNIKAKNGTYSSQIYVLSKK